MSQPFQMVPRSATFGSQMPDYSDGSLRPKMRNEHTLAIHYTGIAVPDSWQNDPTHALQRIQINARNSGRYGTGWEYGYMIHPRDDDKIYEYAGDFLAYHAKGYNYEAMSILLLLGPGDRVTQKMIDKVRWLRWVMEAFATLRADNRLVGHRQLPASTSCPGDVVVGALPAMRNAWVPKDDPVVEPPPPPSDGNITDGKVVADGRYFVESGDGIWRMAAVGYGKGSQAGVQRILEANKAKHPKGIPHPGEVWIIPGVKGVWLPVKQGDGIWSLIRRADETPNGWKVEEFKAWNGHDRKLVPHSANSWCKVFVRRSA